MIDYSHTIMSKEDRAQAESLSKKLQELEDHLYVCPFCGNWPEIDEYEEETGTIGGIPFMRKFFEITCRTCAISKQGPHTEKGLLRLVEWWNTRHTRHPGIEPVK